MRVKAGAMILGCALSFNAFACAGAYKDAVVECHPWSVIGGLGYTSYNDSYSGDGQTPLGRFAIARDIGNYNPFHFGLELGVQSGNQMRLDISENTLDRLGGLPVQVT